MSTAIQVDGKFITCTPHTILKAVVVPGKLVNLLTAKPDPRKQITVRERIKNGKLIRTVKFGKDVPKEIRKCYASHN